MTTSTRDLSQLPDIDRLKALMQSLALLDVILSPDLANRYYSFDAHWATDEAMASMRNGSGDELFALFTPTGAIVKGFAHEAPMSPYSKNPPTIWPGVLDSVPTTFADFMNQPAFLLSDTTFCIWRTYGDIAWQRGDIEFPKGKDPDGSADLLAMLAGDPRTYQVWAEDYYERLVRLSAITHIYEHQPLTEEVVTELNPGLSVQELAQDIQEYRISSRERRLISARKPMPFLGLVLACIWYCHSNRNLT
ncbi:MAG: hypothetical protein JXB30_15715 [Anaerolineae bacterium]|nr:hypothetical protein [Anaerolineae bacterium]